MLDPEFDDFIAKKPTSLADPGSTNVKPRSFKLQTLIDWWPIPRRAQAIFAEALRQAITEDLAIDRAIRLATRVTPGRRFQSVLYQMNMNVRAGYPLDAALARTGVRVQAGLLVALRTGEEHDCLAEALAAFVRKSGKLTAASFHHRIGRSSEAAAFATALAGLVRARGLTVHEVRAAGQIASGGAGAFARIIEQVAARMEDGESLNDALRRHPAHFDALYCEFLEASRSRSELKECLDRLGGMGPT